MSRAIALDLDDTLIDTFPVLHDFIEAHAGARVPRDLLAAYELSHDPAAAEALIEAFFASGADQTIAARTGAQEGCRRLHAQGYELVVVTSRKPEVAAPTIARVEALFPGLFRDVRCVGHIGDKNAALNAVGAAYFVDDHFPHVERAAEMGVASILFGDMPWNKGKNWLHRALDWAELMATLARLNAASP
jgi:FMN phosphatase YigB (HAD superfamily)